jgi:hypothetical protein
MAGAQKVSAPGEQVVDYAADRKEARAMRRRFEAPHLTLALAGGLV